MEVKKLRAMQYVAEAVTHLSEGDVKAAEASLRSALVVFDEETNVKGLLETKAVIDFGKNFLAVWKQLPPSDEMNRIGLEFLQLSTEILQALTG